MFIYVFDRRWPIKTYSLAAGAPAGMESKQFVANKNSSIPSIVTVITGLARGKGSIDTLRLCAHGNAGYLELGEGLDVNNAGHFSALAGLFKPGGGGIEIHGCGVASNTDIIGKGTTGKPQCVPGTHKWEGVGHAFLTMLAISAKCAVTGGVNCQYADERFKYEGRVLVVMPQGELVDIP